MKIRKTRPVAKEIMNCTHHWILDENSFGRCKCGASKQFPVAQELKLRPSERLTIENLATDSKIDSGAWLHAKAPEINFEGEI